MTDFRNVQTRWFRCKMDLFSEFSAKNLGLSLSGEPGARTALIVLDCGRSYYIENIRDMVRAWGHLRPRDLPRMGAEVYENVRHIMWSTEEGNAWHSENVDYIILRRGDIHA